MAETGAAPGTVDLGGGVDGRVPGPRLDWKPSDWGTRRSLGWRATCPVSSS